MSQSLDEQIKDAMYRGDIDRLRELAPCGCCCDYHYFLSCPANAWMGCRGSYAPNRLERERLLTMADVEEAFGVGRRTDLIISLSKAPAGTPVRMEIQYQSSLPAELRAALKKGR